ncbi:hypothetical protein PTKIN_Ptkin11bG0064500 [Pterospermum kingtungense]
MLIGGPEVDLLAAMAGNYKSVHGEAPKDHAYNIGALNKLHHVRPKLVQNQSYSTPRIIQRQRCSLAEFIQHLFRICIVELELALESINVYGVEIYCAPTVDARDVWQASMTHIAVEEGCLVLLANQFCWRTDDPPPPEYMFSGTEDELTPDSVVCAGGSVIISPSGVIPSGSYYDEEALISADLGLYTNISDLPSAKSF